MNVILYSPFTLEATCKNSPHVRYVVRTLDTNAEYCMIVSFV